jgi:segregation and condensation protein B
MSLKAKIEAVLFLTAKPIKAVAMARIVNADVQEVRQALLELVHDYEERAGGLEIADEDGYSFQVKDEYANLMDEFLPVEMSAALIRTLSAIAIKQPIAQSEIIRVRGAGAYDHIRELVNRELVSKKDDQGGRSPMLTTTKKFQEYFRLTKDGKDLRNFLKVQVKKAAEAAEAAKNGQLAIPDMVNPEADNELNNRIFLETADMSMAESGEEAGMPAESGFSPAATDEMVADATANAEAPAEMATQIGIELPVVEAAAEVPSEAETEAETEVPVAAEVEAPASEEVEAPVAAAEAEEPVVAAEADEPVVAAEVEAPVVVASVAINVAPEMEVDVPPPPVVEEPVRARKASKTLSKLRKAADVKQPEPLPEAEPLAEPTTSETDTEADAVTPPATATPSKGSSVQALQSNDGPKISSDDDEPRKPSMLSDLLKKQKHLERAMKQTPDEEVEQTTIDFGVVEPTPPADKTLPN